jgi:HPt (histidine-containing phosphotransfer) domain-containing protein
MNVAKSFENVSIVNSECLSSGTGILVMIAARLAGQGLPVDKIVAELEEAKRFIRTSFVVRDTDIMVRRGRISPFMNNVLNTLWLHPVLRMKDDNLGVGRMVMGNEQKCYEKYIKYALPANVAVDRSFVFVTYAGLSEEELLWIEEKVTERVKFEHVIFQKASAGISSNCGGGTFGLLYLISGNRNYHLESFFEAAEAETDEDVDLYEDDHDEEMNVPEAETEPEPGTEQEKKWYETIPGIDPVAAINNSGSEDAFLAVIRIYYDTYEAKSAEIQGFYDTGDWENYTIKVHALKSSSRLVGATGLGSDAEALEMAGKNLDIDYITSHHDSMMAEYRAIKEALDPVFGAGDDLPDIPADMLADAYAGLSEFVQAQDYELVRMVMDSVKEYKLPDADADRFRRIQDKLSQMDWDGIKEVGDEVNS